MNSVILIGNLASDVETREVGDGRRVATFRLAVQRRFVNQQGEREADFFSIVVWGKAADACARYLCKGRKAAVEGRLQARSYQAQDGGKRYVTEVVAEQVEFLSPAQRESGGSAGRRRRRMDLRTTAGSCRFDHFGDVNEMGEIRCNGHAKRANITWARGRAR